MEVIAYLDESGNSDTGLALSAGYVATLEGWTALIEAWKAALAIPPAIGAWHMKDAARLRGGFVGWTPMQRDQRLALLVALITKVAICQVTVGLRMADYEAVFRGKVPSGDDHPHLLTTVIACQMLLSERERFGISSLSVIFDHHQAWGERAASEGENLAQFLPEEQRGCLRLVHAAPRDRREDIYVPLQAADMLAWHQHRAGTKLSAEDLQRWKWPDLILPAERRVSMIIPRDRLAAALPLGWEHGDAGIA